MFKIALTDRGGVESLIDAEPGVSLMEIIRTAGFDELAALCGGSCSCATCHVYVDDLERLVLTSMSADEDDLLEVSDHRRRDSRLSCQLRFSEELDRLRVEIAPEG